MFTLHDADVLVDVTGFFVTAVPPPPPPPVLPPSVGTLRVITVGSSDECPWWGIGIASPTTLYANGVKLFAFFIAGRYAYEENIAGRSNSAVTFTNATDTLTVPAGMYSCP